MPALSLAIRRTTTSEAPRARACSLSKSGPVIWRALRQTRGSSTCKSFYLLCRRTNAPPGPSPARHEGEVQVKAVVFYEPGRVGVEERPEPKIEAAGDAIVKVSMAPVCGSDIVAYRGRSTPREPGITGHELVGIVSEVGEGVTRLQAGQRVASPFSAWCGGCFYCKKGLLS